MLISTILPSRIVTPITATGCPFGAATRPGVPLTSAGRAWRPIAAKRSGLPGHRPSTANQLGRSERAGPGVGAEHDVGVEHGEQAVEVALAGGREKGVDKSAAAGRGRRPVTGAAPRSRRRARLASCLAAAGERSRIGPICSNGTAKMSCSTNASRSVGDSVSSTTSSASPTESASTACCFGVVLVGATDDRIRHVHVERVLAAGRAGAQHVQAHP